MWRNIASNALSLSIVALIVLGGVIGWGKREYVAEGPLETAICLKVETGSNFTRVSEALDAQGAISSPSIFRMGADYSGKATELKAGSFLVEEHASMEEIVDIVTRGGASTCGTEVVYRIGVNAAEYQVRELDPATQSFNLVAEFDPDVEAPADYTRVRGQPDTRYRVAIAEGATSWQIVDALNKVEFLSGEITEVPPEGMLAPTAMKCGPATTVPTSSPGCGPRRKNASPPRGRPAIPTCPTKARKRRSSWRRSWKRKPACRKNAVRSPASS